MLIEEALRLISENKPHIISILLEFKSRAECTKLVLQKLTDAWKNNNYLQNITIRFITKLNTLEYEKTCTDKNLLMNSLQEYLQPTEGEKCLMNQLGGLSLLTLKKTFLAFLKAQGDNLTASCNMNENGGPPKIFISYSRPITDIYPYEEWTSKFIEKVSEHLREAGIDVAFDRNIDHGCTHGAYMNPYVHERLIASDIIVLFGSECLFYKLYAKTEHVIQKEINSILEKDKNHKLKTTISTLIPIIISGDYDHSLPNEITDIKNGIAFELWNLTAKTTHYTDLLKSLIINIYINSLTLRGKKATVTKSSLIDQWDNNIKKIEPLFQYRKNIQFSNIDTQNRICLHPFFAKENNKGFSTTFNIDRNHVEQIKNKFAEQESTNHFQVVILTGSGGVGKTWSSAQYEISEGVKYSKRLVIHGEINLVEQLQLIAIELGIRPSEYQNEDNNTAKAMLVSAIFKKLDTYESFLIIIDNVKPSKFRIIQDNFTCNEIKKKRHLLLTSRNPLKWKEWNWPDIEITPFNATDTYKYLKNYFKSEKDEAIYALATNLGYLPLALRYTVAYIGKSPISDFLISLNSVPAELFNRIIIDKKDYPVSVYKILMLSFEKLLTKNHTNALQILYIAAFLNPDNLPRQLFKSLFEISIDFDISFNKLLKHSLISYTSSSTNNFSLHRLLQLFIRHRLKLQDKIQYFTIIIQLMQKLFEDGGDPKKRESNAIYFDNFCYFLTYLTKDIWRTLSPDTLISLMGCYHVAFSYKLRVLLTATDALEYLNKAKEIKLFLELNLPNIKDNVSYQEKLASQCNIFVWRRLVEGITENQAFKVDNEFEGYAFTAINYWTERNKQTPNDGRLMRLLMVATSNYGFLVGKQKLPPEKYQVCLDMLEEKIKMVANCDEELRKTLGERWAQCVSAKAHIYFKIGKYNEALKEFNNSFNVYKEHFPALHCNMIYINNLIAKCYTELLDSKNTEDSAKKSLELCEQIDPSFQNATVGLERLKCLAMLLYITEHKKDNSSNEEYSRKFNDTIHLHKLSDDVVQNVKKFIPLSLKKLDPLIVSSNTMKLGM